MKKILLHFFLILFVGFLGHMSTAQANLVSNCSSKSSSRNCLICNCYFESRGEPYADKLATAMTVRRRAARPDFNNTICSVVHSTRNGRQYSWTSNSRRPVRNNSAGRECRRAADRVLARELRTNVPVFYQACYLRRNWMTRNCRRIPNHAAGNHCFYDCGRNRGLNRSRSAPMRAISSVTEAQFDKSKPRFYLKSGIRTLHIPALAREVLNAKWPGFKLMNEDIIVKPLRDSYNRKDDGLAVADMGDFNGDDQLDILIMGQANSKQYAVLLLADNSSWKIKLLDSWSYEKPAEQSVKNLYEEYSGFPHSVRRIPASELIFKGSQLSSRDGIQLETYWGPVRAYYYKDDKLVKYEGLAK